MRILSPRTLRNWQTAHAQQAPQLEDWYNVVRQSAWRSLADTRREFPQVDQVGSCLIFNIGRNFRLICGVVWENDQRQGILFLKHYLTHKQYDRGAWKKDCQHET